MDGLPVGLTVNGASLYWAALNTSVMKVPLGGGVATTLASGQSPNGGVAVNATSVYWTSFGDNSNDGGVMRLPLE
jgi:hypothetical protein